MTRATGAGLIGGAVVAEDHLETRTNFETRHNTRKDEAPAATPTYPAVQRPR